MFYSERQKQLLDLLQEEKSMTVHRMARLMNISESSIRRDLAVLEEMGKIRRTFGGAVFYDAAEREVSLLYRKNQRLTEKQEIARQAASFLHDGMLVFLDASSSAAQMLPHFEAFKDITVVTNSPLTSVALGEKKIRNYCTGGLLLNNSVACVGPAAEDSIRRFTADIMFFSCRGLSDDGVLSDSMEEEVHIRSVMLRHARRKIFLCDRSKYGLSFHYRLCSVSDVDAVVTEPQET